MPSHNFVKRSTTGAKLQNCQSCAHINEIGKNMLAFVGHALHFDTAILQADSRADINRSKRESKLLDPVDGIARMEIGSTECATSPLSLPVLIHRPALTVDVAIDVAAAIDAIAASLRPPSQDRAAALINHDKGIVCTLLAIGAYSQTVEAIVLNPSDAPSPAVWPDSFSTSYDPATSTDAAHVPLPPEEWVPGIHAALTILPQVGAALNNLRRALCEAAPNGPLAALSPPTPEADPDWIEATAWTHLTRLCSSVLGVVAGTLLSLRPSALSRALKRPLDDTWHLVDQFKRLHPLCITHCAPNAPSGELSGPSAPTLPRGRAHDLCGRSSPSGTPADVGVVERVMLTEVVKPNRMAAVRIRRQHGTQRFQIVRALLHVAGALPRSNARQATGASPRRPGRGVEGGGGMDAGQWLRKFDLSATMIERVFLPVWHCAGRVCEQLSLFRSELEALQEAEVPDAATDGHSVNDAAWAALLEHIRRVCDWIVDECPPLLGQAAQAEAHVTTGRGYAAMPATIHRTRILLSVAVRNECERRMNERTQLSRALSAATVRIGTILTAVGSWQCQVRVIIYYKITWYRKHVCPSG